jgi:hypothetical protein
VIHGHKYFEMQGALSATGHLAGSELLELEQHVSQCPSCRIYMLDMAAMSRELFLMQDDRRRSKTPPGMHNRFLRKAVAAGIALRPEGVSSTSLDLRFDGALAITVFLAALISFGWTFASMSRVERAAVKRPSAMGAVSKDALERTTQQQFGLRAAHTSSVSERRSKRGATVRGRSAVKGFHVPNSEGNSRSYAVLNMPLAADQGISTSVSTGSAFWSEGLTQSYLTAGMRSACRSPLTRTYVANLFGLKWDGNPVEHSFHLDLTLASLSRLDSPFNANASARVPSLKFSTPAFHIDPSRSW